ncbi:hypothetical protein NMG60_11024210 [Bertholletia excelsa]
MGSLSGVFHRPVVAAAAVALASVSTDLRDKLWLPESVGATTSSEQSNSLLQQSESSWVSNISVSKLASLSFVNRIPVPVPTIKNLMANTGHCYMPINSLCPSVASTSFLLNSYQSAELVKSAKPTAFGIPSSTSSPEVVYRWHLPEPKSIDVSGNSDCSSVKSRTVVVLLGWLGSKQKHLNRYAEWYTLRGFHAITFTFPMAEILGYQVGGKAEQHIESLVNHLVDWLDEEYGKNLVFHTFSNTGWLTYGVILEKFQKQNPSLIGRIKGCVVDSAPVAAPNPQVWASGFSAAFLKKHSIATKGITISNESPNAEPSMPGAKPAVTESALLLILEKFFEVVLNLPAINRRLSDVLGLLTSAQPKCPQLYIYSSADRVIPSGSVESFIEEQRRSGRQVRACNFISTPHVDHFRNDPKLYSSQLTQFLEDSVLASCKHSTS